MTLVRSRFHAVRQLAGLAALLLVTLGLMAGEATAQRQRTIVGERHVPTIWIDPDGCEHWVFDDGLEGYMTPNRAPDGRPVCHRNNACLTESTDSLFQNGSYHLRPGVRERLAAFFREHPASAYAVYAHSDPAGNFQTAMTLSENRARTVANIAIANGGRVSTARGYGPMYPVAANNSAAGRQRNRRLEILCFR